VGGVVGIEGVWLAVRGAGADTGDGEVGGGA